MTDKEVVYQKWESVLLSKSTEIRAIADTFPDTRSVVIDYQNIRDPELQEWIANDPETCIQVGEAYIQSLLEPDQKAGLNLRICNLYNHLDKRIRDLRAEDLAKFKTIEGEIRKVTDVKDRLVIGVFECTSCGFRQEIVQDRINYLEPLDCPKDMGGCGKKHGATTFKFVIAESLFIDSQKILLQEKREDLRGHQQPKSIELHLSDDMAGEWTPGDIIRVNSEVGSKQEGGRQSKLSTFTKYLDVNYIDTENIEGYHISYTMEEIDEIITKMKGEVVETLVESFAPNLIGLDRLKQVLLYQLVGGTRGQGYRADLMTVIVGDPGTGKSKVCEWACSLIPGSVILDASEGNITPNGLKATAIKENVTEFGEGNWTLEAGALVMAHQKMFMLDECHLAKNELIGALHVPMDEQKFAIAKAGLNRTFICEFSGMFVMNPQEGRFIINEERGTNDRLKPLIDLIDTKKFTAPFDDRIDYWCAVYDPEDEERDKKVADQITRHKRKEIQSVLSREEISKYIAYVKDTFHPIIPESLDELNRTEYVKLRKKGMEGPGAYTRHLISVQRFAEASAKLNMRDEVTEGDYRLGVTLVTESLRTLTAGVSGEVNPHAQIRGASLNKQGKYETIQRIILELSEANEFKGAPDMELVIRCEEERIENYERLINDLSDRGNIIYSQKDGIKTWRVNK